MVLCEVCPETGEILREWRTDSISGSSLIRRKLWVRYQGHGDARNTGTLIRSGNITVILFGE